MTTVNERPTFTCNGWAMIALIAIVFALAMAAFQAAHPGHSSEVEHPEWLLVGVPLLAAGLLSLRGFFTVQPNQARVLVFLGGYSGTERQSGFRWANPFATRRMVSLRAQNAALERLKVNDSSGNPIEIAAMVVWRVRDTARAVFDVEDYQRYVLIQGETALRALAMHYPYEDRGQGVSLRGNPDQIAEALRQQVQARLDVAGIEVVEARLTHLAYAPEIAQSMLRVQQADAVIAARHKIVEGAVGMVEMALKMLSDKAVVVLDDERKAAMINNLLVSLVSESQAQPIINTGTVYP